jgi:hypothetical protein
LANGYQIRLFSLSANSDDFINDNFLNAWVFWFHLLSKLFIDYNESEPNYPNKNIVYDVGRIILAGFWYNNKSTYDVRYLS